MSAQVRIAWAEVESAAVARAKVAWAEVEGLGGAACRIAWAEIEGTEVAVVTPPTSPSGGGVGAPAWRNYARKPKRKRTLLEELDDMLIELRERIEPEAEEADYPTDLIRAEAFAYNAMVTDYTIAEIGHQLALVRAILREMDDEDAILLSIH
jgi:hypothetical protein